MHIYDKLEYLCSLKKVSVPEAYNEMKINKGTISLWRTARDEGQIVIPSTKNAIKLSNYFGYPVDYFLNGNEVGQKEKSPSQNREGLTSKQQEAIDFIKTLSEPQLNRFLKLAEYAKEME